MLYYVDSSKEENKVIYLQARFIYIYYSIELYEPRSFYFFLVI